MSCTDKDEQSKIVSKEQVSNKVNGIHVIATGHYTPSNVVTNDDLSKIVDTNDEWIRQRTGICKRHFAVDEKNFDLAYNATKMALDNANIDLAEVGALVVATFSIDNYVPSMACMLQKELGLPEDIPCFDLNAACSGFLYGLHVARGLLLQTERKYAIVVGSELISKFLDMTDRGTCILFGDGAGAAIIQLDSTKQYAAYLGARGDAKAILCQNEDDSSRKILMEGNSVFRFAVLTVPKCIKEVLKKAGLEKDDIDYYVCHQANRRIIEHVANKLDVPIERFYMNLQEYGNTSAASVPIALSEMNAAGLLKPGMKVLCVGFGAGLTWGGTIIEW